jgi:nucleotide-binding universal stress UspA family protein
VACRARRAHRGGTARAPDLALAWAAGDDEADRALATRELSAAVAGLDVPVDLRIERGDPAQVIRAVAAGTGCDLVVTGMARSERLAASS